MNKKTPRFREMFLEDDPVKRENLAKNLGFNIIVKPHGKKFVHRFKDEIVEKPIFIKKSPYPEDWGKKECVISKEHEIYFQINKILYFNTKVKGEIQSIGKGEFVHKKSENKGFFDMVLIIKGLFIGLELKKGDGEYWAVDQIKTARAVREKGNALTFVSNSVRLTTEFLIKEKLLG